MNFSFYEPAGLEEAIEILQKNKGNAALLAGGSDLIPKIKAEKIDVEHIISINDMETLKNIDCSEVVGLTFGAAVTLRDLEKNADVKAQYPALYEGIHSMASTQIRNVGTVVGNICNAVPSADTAPALLVYDAEINIAGPEGIRTVKAADFFTGVCKTVLEPDEIVVSISLPAPAKESSSKYIKFTVRRALELAMVGVAVNGAAENGVCSDIKIALGAVAATPVRAANAEAYLKGKEITAEVIEEAALIASEKDCQPISDKRASAEYRKALVKSCTKDALSSIFNLDGGK